MVIRPYHVPLVKEAKPKKKVAKKLQNTYKKPSDKLFEIKKTSEVYENLMKQSRFSQIIEFLFKP